MGYVILYLAAIVAANLSVAHFGPPAVIINAFLFIGLDLTARDKLHEKWQGRKLPVKMAALIATGSALSWALNRDAGIIAVASFVAFAAAGVVDTAVFQSLIRSRRMIKINGSNVAAALVDSLVFPTIAFGAIIPSLIIGQFIAKVGGGFVWSLIIARANEAE